MPSWNIHIAQTERLMARGGALARVVHDRNAFLFGSLLPDIYVGYMVPGIKDPIPYRITHFATPAHIPKPREGEFWGAYVAPAARKLGFGADADLEKSEHAAAASDLRDTAAAPGLGDASDLRGASGLLGGAVIPPGSLAVEQDYVSRLHYPQRYEDAEPPVWLASPEDDDVSPAALERSLFDLLLGTWSHLLADNIWNTRVNEFLDAHGGKPSESFRIKKQGDFDLFGKALPIDALPRMTPRLMATVRAFPQYAIDEAAMLTTIGAAHEIVRTNHGGGDPRYQLLTSDFFEHVFAENLAEADRLAAGRL